MHELGITMEIVEAISDRLEDYGCSRVKKVILEIGALASVLPDSIRFCFDLCAQGTPIEGAELEIVEVLGIGDCKKCRRVMETPDPFAMCSCGSMEFDWKCGREI